jgi:serine protease inhibitor
MSAATDPMNKLYVTRVLHKAFVEVGEEGTEAAATAIVLAEPQSAPATFPFTPTFKGDRPFVFLIRDRKSGAVLFLGRVLGPRKGT